MTVCVPQILQQFRDDKHVDDGESAAPRTRSTSGGHEDDEDHPMMDDSHLDDE